MIKTNRIVCVKRQHGHGFHVVREHYLREDIPCYSKLCLGNCSNNYSEKSKVVLPRDCTHYVVPDCLSVMKYLDIYELPQIGNTIIMQTVANTIQHESGRRHYRRLQNLLKDPNKNDILFHNEFQKYAFCKRKESETKQDWWTRSIYEATVWYYNHLAGQMPIVMVTTDSKVAAEYNNRTAGVLVLTMTEYLENFWSDLEAAALLYESLTTAEQLVSEKDTDFYGYLPQEMLEAGIKSGVYIQGSLQVSKYNAASEAFVKKSSHTKDTGDQTEVLVSGSSHRNRAIHGDVVVIEMLPRQQWKTKSDKIKETTEVNSTETGDSEDNDKLLMPTGKVVGILQRNWRDYVVSFSEEQETGQHNKAGKVLVIPWDWRIPKIRISTRQVETLKTQRIVVRLDNWERDSQYPNGHFVRSLGQSGELETEIAALLVENQISVAALTESLLKELPVNTTEDPWHMDETEISKRRDIRESHLVFSIDPKGCEDVDDTLSVRQLANGNTELGVHIADVTYFVRPDTLVDTEARSRSTSVYLADRRYDMLPAVLSSDLCSLISGVDRYAMSVIWELDANYEVQDVWFGRTVIRSKYKLFYEIAQQIHDGVGNEVLIENIPELQSSQTGTEQGKDIEELRWAVLSLMAIARGLKSKRTRHGALELEGLELRVQIRENKEGPSQIEDLLPKQALEIHETIAECMIFANHWVAKKICQAYPNCAILRHHPLPREEYFGNLTKCAASKGFHVKTRTNKELAESLDRCVDSEDPQVNKLLRMLATQAMSNAAYFSTGSLDRDKFFHYGLALDYYTHFTSPIRRYADILVHRLLLSALKVDDGSQLLSNTELHDLCQHINAKHRDYLVETRELNCVHKLNFLTQDKGWNKTVYILKGSYTQAAQDAQRSSQELFQTLFFRDKSPDDQCCVVDAVIYQLKANGLLIFVPRYSIRGPVYLRSKEGQVLYVPQNSSPEWVGGTISLSDSTLNINSAYGDQTYHLFDHITVKVSVREMHAHPSVTRLDLLHKRKHSAQISQSDAKKQKGAMIQEVQYLADERRRNQEVVELGEDFLRWKVEYGQTNGDSSFYHLLQSFQTMAMLDI